MPVCHREGGRGEREREQCVFLQEAHKGIIPVVVVSFSPPTQNRVSEFSKKNGIPGLKLDPDTNPGPDVRADLHRRAGQASGSSGSWPSDTFV